MDSKNIRGEMAKIHNTSNTSNPCHQNEATGHSPTQATEDPPRRDQAGRLA